MWGIIVAVNVILAITLTYRIINHYQLDGYKFKGNTNIISWSLYLAIVGLAGLLITQLTAAYSNDTSGYIGSSVALILPLGLVAIMLIGKRKTPLRFTRRVMRLYALVALLTLAFELTLIALAKLVELSNIIMLSPIIYALQPLIFHTATMIIYPVERAIQGKFIRQTQAKIASKNIIKIGITGSYAKTSVKSIVTKMLAQKYNVLATPYSYNTPMGICVSAKAITDETQVFIAEMGARRKGDIKELCDIVRPDIGILTGIAPVHMGSFKSMTNIVDTKYELIESLPQRGKAVFNGDNNELSRLFYRCNLAEKYLVKCASGYIHLENVEVSSEGSSFELVIGEERAPCNTVLLGSHNLSNITVGAMVAHCLDVPIADIAIAISQLDYEPHRLQIIKASNGVTIIDDSYNCNIEGAKCAINTLALFPNRRVVVTQGAVEMGDMEHEVNYKIGLMLANVADIVVAVGRRGKVIASGLRDCGCNPTKIVEVKTLAIATEMFPSLLRSGDVLLLMNDLPDNYC